MFVLYAWFGTKNKNLKVDILNDNNWIRWNTKDPEVNFLGQKIWQNCTYLLNFRKVLF